MTDFLSLALANLSSPPILFFVLGFMAAFARSDLSIPEAVGKALAIYLMLAIGFKGGVAMNDAGLNRIAVLALIAGAALSFMIPFVAFGLLRASSRLDRVNAAAVSAHYGSVSVVTFVSATQFLERVAISYEGVMVAVVAAMETPAIIAGLMLARQGASPAASNGFNAAINRQLLREVLLNGSVVLLIGAFVIGWISGAEGMTAISPFVSEPFQGVLCLFLLDMGIVAGARIREGQQIQWPVVLFAAYLPLIGAAAGTMTGAAIGLSVGGATLLGVLAASASYIAVPAAMRLALPEASPGLYLTLSLALTFPFNILIGIPLYLIIAQALIGG